MGQDDRPRRPKDVGFERELMLSDLLQKDGVVLRQSQELDTKYATDFLVSAIDRMDGTGREIAVQVTKGKPRAKKVRSFFERAAACTDGPLLYAEILGEPTQAMARAMKRAMKELWRHGRRRQRGHGLVVYDDGRLVRFDPYRFLQTGEHPRNKKGRKR